MSIFFLGGITQVHSLREEEEGHLSIQYTFIFYVSDS